MRRAGFIFIGIVFSIVGIFGGGIDLPASPLDPPVLRVSESRGDRPLNTVRGMVDQIGRGFVIVDGKRFQVAATVRVVDEEEGILENGLGALKPLMKVELILEGQTVVQIKAFGLLMK
jgi:hypothetical protein